MVRAWEVKDFVTRGGVRILRLRRWVVVLNIFLKLRGSSFRGGWGYNFVEACVYQYPTTCHDKLKGGHFNVANGLSINVCPVKNLIGCIMPTFDYNNL